jgi:hypothetical protein
MRMELGTGVVNFRVLSIGCFSCRLCEHSTAAEAADTNRYNLRRVANFCLWAFLGLRVFGQT